MPRALQRTLGAVADGVVGDPVVPPGDVVARITATWEEMQPAGRRALAAMLLALDSAALLRTGRRWHRLPSSRRTALCDALEQRAALPWRSAFVGVKTLVLVAYGDDERAGHDLGTAGWPPQSVRP